MDKLTATCTKCDVALEVDNIEDDASMTRCPSCGTEFGRWGEVKAAITKMAGDQLRTMAKETLKDHPWIKVE